MKNLLSNPLELKLYGMEWNWNGMEISPQMKLMQNGMEIEWKWNGNFITKQIDANWNGKGMELEWKWNAYKWPSRHGS